MKHKIRVDDLLVERGLVEKRQTAAALVLAGSVLVNEQRVDKPGTLVDRQSAIRFKSDPSACASRAGLKLEKALEHFELLVDGLCCLDVGASTGGFVDCLLRRGASKVFAVDVGRGQLAWRLQSDARVVRIEGINARYLRPEDIGARLDLITVDVSFISLCQILPALRSFESPVLALVKPQFELPAAEVGPGGVVRDAAARRRAVGSVLGCARQAGFDVRGDFDSPVAGAQGNVETFVYLI